jgi:hypothetical protein
MLADDLTTHICAAAYKKNMRERERKRERERREEMAAAIWL